jgi:hypothetical protein
MRTAGVDLAVRTRTPPCASWNGGAAGRGLSCPAPASMTTRCSTSSATPIGPGSMLSVRPLSVSTDRIGVATFRCALLLDRLSHERRVKVDRSGRTGRVGPRCEGGRCGRDEAARPPSVGGRKERGLDPRPHRRDRRAEARSLATWVANAAAAPTPPGGRGLRRRSGRTRGRPSARGPSGLASRTARRAVRSAGSSAAPRSPRPRAAR